MTGGLIGGKGFTGPTIGPIGFGPIGFGPIGFGPIGFGPIGPMTGPMGFVPTIGFTGLVGKGLLTMGRAGFVGKGLPTTGFWLGKPGRETTGFAGKFGFEGKLGRALMGLVGRLKVDPPENFWRDPPEWTEPPRLTGLFEKLLPF